MIRIILLILCFPFVLTAEDFIPLSMDDCVKEALEKGPDLQAAALTWGQNQDVWAVTRAENGFSLTGSTGAGAQGAYDSTTSQFGQNLSGSVSLASPSTKASVSASHQLTQELGSTLPTTSLSVNLSQQIFDGYPGGKTAGAMEQSQLALEGQRLIWEQAKTAVIYSVKTAYTLLLGTQKILDAKKAAWDAQAENLVTTKAYLEAKKVTQLDVIQAEYAAEAARLDWLAAQNDRRNASGKLALLLGRPWESSLTAQELPVSADQVPTRAEAMKTALEQRHEIRQAQLDRKNSDIALALKKAEVMPTVSLTGGVNYKKLWGSSRFEASDTAGLSGGLAMDISLWDGGLRQAQENTSQKAVAISALNETQIRNSVTQDVDAALFTLNDARERRALAERNVLQTKMALESAQLKFDAGIAARLDVLNALSAWTNATSSLTQAITTEETAWLTLKKSEGLPQ